jgi:outer membrane lipoprotein-sorting protein
VSLRRLVLVFFLMLSSALSAFAQVDTGSIVGTVVDGQQQRIADASIELTQESTGVERTVKSGRENVGGLVGWRTDQPDSSPSAYDSVWYHR